MVHDVKVEAPTPWSISAAGRIITAASVVAKTPVTVTVAPAVAVTVAGSLVPSV